MLLPAWVCPPQGLSERALPGVEPLKKSMSAFRLLGCKILEFAGITSDMVEAWRPILKPDQLPFP